MYFYKKNIMKYNFTQIFVLFIITFLTFQGSAQTTVCDGVFEEENGLLVIEMESAKLPVDSNWQLGNEPDPDQPGATINYLFWNGPESFANLSNALITYNIRINTPGTYRFLVRGRIGMGNLKDRHNDFWMNIEADDYFAERRSNGQLVSVLGPESNCNSIPDRGCADSAKNGDEFMKIFMNVVPTNGDGEERDWRFVSNVNTEGVLAHLLIKAVFNEAGNYSINIDARSSYYFMDKIVFFRDGVSRSVAEDLANPESTCNEDSLSINDIENINSIKIFPNPATNSITISNLSANNQGKFVLRNILGATIRQIDVTSANQNIDISDLESGTYFISSLGTKSFTQKIIKL